MSESVMMSQREQDISNLYQTLLGRKPDAPGLKHYMESPLSIEDIRADIMLSDEYTKRVKSETFIDSLRDTNSSELLVLGATPTKMEHVEALKKFGVESVLDVNLGPSRFFESNWKGDYKHVALSKRTPFTIERVSDALEFMFNTLFVERKKLFVHSELGMSRAPLLIALFLVAERGMNFYEAVKVVVHKHKEVNPSKTLVTADLLEFVKTFRQKMDTGNVVVHTNKGGVSAKPIQLSDTLFVSAGFSQEHLNAEGIDVVYDISSSGIAADCKGIDVVRLPMAQNAVGTLMPAVLKSTVNRSRTQKVCVVTDDMGILLFYVENIYKEYIDALSNPTNINKVRMSLLEHP